MNSRVPGTTLLLAFFLFLTVGFANGQTTREKGIDSYKKKDYKSAITALTQVVRLDKNDAEALNVLGMAYVYDLNFKEGRKALEGAVKVEPRNPSYLINLAYVNVALGKLGDADEALGRAISLKPDNELAFYLRGVVNQRKEKYDQAIADADQAILLDKSSASAYILKSESYIYDFGQKVYKTQNVADNLNILQKSSDALVSCLSNCKKTDLPAVQAKLDAAKAFWDYFSRDRNKKFEALDTAPDDPTVTPLHIISKPRASYTDSARQAGTQGTLYIAVLFGADSKSKTAMVLKPLSNGLTEEALSAVNAIKFNSQLKDGKAVPVVKVITYSFTLY